MASCFNLHLLCTLPWKMVPYFFKLLLSMKVFNLIDPEGCFKKDPGRDVRALGREDAFHAGIRVFLPSV